MINWLKNRKTPMVDFTVENVALLLEKLGNPQDKIKTIHITGTNGKGSLVAFLESSMVNNGYTVGTFTSPFLTNINESIKINGENISDKAYDEILKIIYPIVCQMDKIDKYATGFEIQVACAFLYFYRKNVDLAIIEVGMGGRFDATNVMKKPLLSAFTSISLDHTNLLGKNLKEIAWQKGGIIKRNCPTFTYPQSKEAENELKIIAKEMHSQVSSFSFDQVKIIREDMDGNEFSFRTYKNVKTDLIGHHQIYNATLALVILTYLKNIFSLDDDKIKSGIQKAKNPGRLEIISKDPLILIDGSHNNESIDALLANLSKFKYDKLILGFSLLKDKDREGIIKKMAAVADEIVLTEIDSDRKSSVDDLYNLFKSFSHKKIYKFTNREEAVHKTLDLITGKNNLLLWCGSLYLMKDIRRILLEKTAK